MPTPDNPDEFYLLLALVLTMVPLQWWLARKLHARSTAGTSFWNCFFAVSNADFHSISQAESDEFKTVLKSYKRIYIVVMIPVLAVLFAIYLWLKSR